MIAGILFIFSSHCTAPSESVVAIVGTTIIHPECEGSAVVESNCTMILSDGRIQSMGPSKTMKIPKGAKAIQGRGKWVIPGLIDSHVHFFQSGNLYTRPDVLNLTEWVPYAQEVARNKARLPATFKVWLANGVTGVADMGGPYWNFEVRKAANQSQAAPRVAAAGPLISTVERKLLDLGDPPIIQVASPEAARALAEKELKYKPDFIKAWFIYKPGDNLVAKESIMKAAGGVARRAGLPFAVHATELVTAKAALHAGADILVHSVGDQPVDDEFLALARKNKAVYIPTLASWSCVVSALLNRWKPTPVEQLRADPQILSVMNALEKIPKSDLETLERPLRKLLPPPVIDALEKNAPIPSPTVASKNLRAVWDAGITVAMGTDAGNPGILHGPSVFREMEFMAEAGLTSLEVLRSATVNAAKVMGRNDMGTIAPGRLADLVLLNADPLENVKNMSKIALVIKGGTVFDPEALLNSIR